MIEPWQLNIKLASVAAELNRRNALGFAYNGKTFQIYDASQARITALAVKAVRVVGGETGATWDDGFVFIAADNSSVPMTAAEFGPFADAASNAVIALRMKARGIKDQIVAAYVAQDYAAFDAVDVTAGWE